MCMSVLLYVGWLTTQRIRMMEIWNSVRNAMTEMKKAKGERRLYGYG